ncbi:MAG: 30S ribosomal protein S6 [Candidatus Paceibacterota bacterium]
MSEETKNYEIGFLLKSEEDRKVVFGAIERAGFGLVNEGQISSIKLAYPIKKQNFAQFGYAYFSADPAKVEEFRKDLSMAPGVLRLTVFANPVIKTKEDEARAERAYFENEKSAEAQQEVQPAKERRQAAKPQKTEVLSNEDLEKRLEEILK